MSEATPISLYSPRTFGQILERVYRLLRGNFGLLFGVASVPGLIFLVSYGAIFAIWAKEIISTVRTSNPEDVIHMVRMFSVLFAPVMLLYLAVFALYFAAASYAAVLADCGTRVTFREAYRVAWSRLGHYFLLVLTLYAITFLPALLLEIPIFASATAMGSNKTAPNPALILLFPVEFFLIFASVVVGIVVALRLSLAFPASVFESLKVREAIKRSWALTRGALGRIFLVVVVIYAAIYAITTILIFGAIAVGAVGFLVFGAQNTNSQNAWVLPVILGIIVYVALIAICTVGTWAGFTTAFGVIYNDQRLRSDGPPASQPLPGAPA